MRKYDAAPPVPALIVTGVALIILEVHWWNPTDVLGMRVLRSGIGMLIFAGAIVWRRLARAKIPPGGYLEVKGSLKMDDLADLHDIQLPMDPCYTTVGGFMLEQLKHSPCTGEAIDFSGYRFTVAEIDRTAISRVRIQELTGRPHVDAIGELIRRCEDASSDERRNTRRLD